MSHRFLFFKFPRFWLFVASFFIALLFLIAIFAYAIAPDDSPMANEQHLETSFLPPGAHVQFLLIPKKNFERSNILNNLWMGFPTKTDNIPIHQYKIKNDTVFVEKYTGMTPNEGEIVSFSIFDFYHERDSQLANENDFATIVEKNIQTRYYMLGTDRFGRDVLSRLLIGSRVSLSVGFVSVTIALLLGVFAGAWAGYFGGWVDRLIMYLISVIWSLPTILLVIAITFALGRGFWQIFLAIGFTLWVEVARIIRGQVISIKQKEFVKAAVSAGFPHHRIIIHHILPSLYGTIFVLAASDFASAIMIESGLSFLGIGISPPMPSWGMMIKEYYGHLVLDTAYLALVPGIAIMLLILSFLIIGRELRDLFDVKIN